MKRAALAALLTVACGTSSSGTEVGAKDVSVEQGLTDVAVQQCPASDPLPLAKPCAEEGLRCEYGQECCCGKCYPSLVCECHGGQFRCYYTDACMIPHCPDAEEISQEVVISQDVFESEVMQVECMGEPSYFPSFERSCSDDTDCVVAFHQINCCGTEVALGIATSEKAAFGAAEAECRAQYPPCGCPALPTVADDGNTAADPSAFTVRCKGGQCFSVVKGLPARCHDHKDCAVYETCIAPGETAPCGICQKLEDQCQSDEECSPSEVCELVFGPCLCHPAYRCVLRCDLPMGNPMPACMEGLICAPSGHCIEQPCVSSEECPTFFTCASDVCRRKQCAFDDDCPGGWCVEGQCHSTLGTCAPVPP